MADKARPSKDITLSESGVKITMTYMVFNDILRFVGTIEEAMNSVLTNQDTRDLIIRRVLTDSKKPVQDLKDLKPVEEVEIDIFEMDEILSWVMEHITYFFMRTAARIQDSVGQNPEVLKKMTESSDPSKTGSQP